MKLIRFSYNGKKRQLNFQETKQRRFLRSILRLQQQSFFSESKRAAKSLSSNCDFC